MLNSYFLQDFFVYDLSGNEITKKDIKAAHDMNLLTRGNRCDEFFIVGSFNAILSYLNDYIGVEMVSDYLVPLKNVLSNSVL